MDNKIKILTVSSLEKIFPCENISFPEREGSMLKNERYSFQIVLKSDELLLGVKLKISGDNSKYCRIRRVDLVPAYMTEMDPPVDYCIKKSATLYPDILVDSKCDDISLRPGLWTSFWITVENMPVGENKINFVAEYEKEKSSATYTLTVIDEKLSDNKVIYTNWMHYDCIANYYHLKMFSKKYYDILGKYMDDAVMHGINLLYTPLFTPPLDTEIGGERKTVQLVDVEKTETGYNIGFDRLKEFINFAQSHGFEMFEFSHLFTQWGAKHAPKIVDVKGKKLFGWETQSDGDEYLAFLDAFLSKLNVFIEDNGLLGKCYFHLSDEPKAQDVHMYEKLSKFIRKSLSNAILMDTMSDYDSYDKGLMDVSVVETSKIDYFLENKKKIWAYYACCQYKNSLSNRFLNFPSERTRVIGIQLYINDIKGFLHWGFNFYNSYLSKWEIDPYRVTDASGAFPAGDPFVVYPAKNGVYDSLRNELLYDALQDYRALRRLEEKKGREFTVNLLKEHGYMQNFTTYPHSMEALSDLRREINKNIMLVF